MLGEQKIQWPNEKEQRSMQNTTQKIKDRATPTSLLDIWHRHCSSYNALTLFFEIYILPTIDTGEALRIVPR
jgi:hypothetical protein